MVADRGENDPHRFNVPALAVLIRCDRLQPVSAPACSPARILSVPSGQSRTRDRRCESAECLSALENPREARKPRLRMNIEVVSIEIGEPR